MLGRSFKPAEAVKDWQNQLGQVKESLKCSGRARLRNLSCAIFLDSTVQKDLHPSFLPDEETPYPLSSVFLQYRECVCHSVPHSSEHGASTEEELWENLADKLHHAVHEVSWSGAGVANTSRNWGTSDACEQHKMKNT